MSRLSCTALALGAEPVLRTGATLLGLAEDQCRMLAGDMADVITRHGRDGRVLFASPNAKAALGVPAGDLMGRGLFERVHVADRPAYLKALSDAGAAGNDACGAEPFSVEFRLRKKAETGRTAPGFIWIEMRCRLVDRSIAPGGDNRQVIAVMRDVNARRARQEALIESRAEAERANAAKSRFLAVMRHELRTPLNAIIGFSEMLGNETEFRVDAYRRREYARLINESGLHLLALVNDMLNMSRLDTGDFEVTLEPFKVGAVIAGCHELLDLKAQEAGIGLSYQLPAALPDIVADKRAVKQILINLISNAVKFTNSGGTVKTSARVERPHLLISVEDTGIAPGDLGRIGDPFYQACGNYARRHDGAGLGLSIVKGLVRLHGGELEIRSVPGEGTCVTVRLPLDCEVATAAAANSTPRSEPVVRVRA